MTRNDSQRKLEWIYQNLNELTFNERLIFEDFQYKGYRFHNLSREDRKLVDFIFLKYNFNHNHDPSEE